ncbi:MAG TPA: polyribonucleotide nucleotidyltransferase [candidate division WWE3 bacterium]|uniref:Polyribonucleotide nucleotidyltransferase n=1 Tax=candidate division WWE3 bacterium TaxID=2053526 RepID=A0A7C1DP19_UNCKA|nr:polyribonucleotide nucleotidyltransferase [candidate division WWE3 bacterium]
MNKYAKKEIDFAGRKLVLETGKLAGQANMSVQVTYGESVVLTTAVSGGLNPELDYFPLSINYEERLYASGLIKSSRFVKREGRPTDEATIIRRLIDHAVRPLFPSDYKDEVQVVNTVLSLDPASDPRFLSMIGTSVALTASNIPWEGPIVSAIVGYVIDEYVLNPSKEELEKSRLNLMVSFVGKDLKYLAMEAEADILPEEVVLGGIEFARNRLEVLVDMILEFAAEVNPEGKKYEYVSQALSEELIADVKSVIGDRIEEMIYGGFKTNHEFHEYRDSLLEEVYTAFEGKYKKTDMAKSFEEIEKDILQTNLVKEEKRPDGRGLKEVRNIACEVSVLPRTHGSALFSRGVTQVLTVATLGSPNMELIMQDMYGEDTKRYMHFYNFPPYSVGETGRMGGAGGREIGHGMLAERALKPVIPSQEKFPYTILLMSETLSSSGSSSMAATCGSTLSLMDAGVPITDMVAGVGIGLMATDDFSEYKVITDLAYREDAFGLLDFKMTGTRTGVTAIQCDMKAKGIPMDLLVKIFEQSKEGRLHVLDEMQKVISTPNVEVSKYAPKSDAIKIDPDKIGTVIGSGGKTIKELQESTNTEVNIDEDGTVTVTGIEKANVTLALERIVALVKDIERGEIYEGVVEEVVDFGAFVEILPGKNGLLHVSEISHDYVENVRDYLKAGDKVRVKVLDVDRGKVSLSKKALEEKPSSRHP